jgi:hypothetical protein
MTCPEKGGRYGVFFFKEIIFRYRLSSVILKGKINNERRVTDRNILYSVDWLKAE